ncbi:30S ribosomal protein THX [bacterium BMS3Abin03]|nr:30S ribosomal protein THX [bacterium BMS3Abin03]
MGKGDKKSRRGKIYRGSFGKRRLRKKIKNIVITPVAEKVEKEEKKETTVEEVKPEKEKTEKAAVEEKPKKKKSTKKRSKE